MLTEISLTGKLVKFIFTWVVPVLLVIGIILYGVNFIYEKGDQNGANRITSEWQADIIAKAEEREQELKRVREEAAKALRKQEEDNLKLKESRDEKIQKLNSDITKLRNRGLFVTATACSDRGAGEAESTGVDGKTPGRVRLPEEVERGLSRIVEDAQTVVAQYESCRTRLKQIADIIPDSGLISGGLY